MLKRYVVLVISFGLFSAAASAGEFSATEIGSSLAWESTKCSKPPKLFFHITDVDTYNAAVEEYNRYLVDVRTYRSCVADEAQSDAQTAAQSISSGVDEAYEQIRMEIDSAKSELESARRTLQ